MQNAITHIDGAKIILLILLIYVILKTYLLTKAIQKMLSLAIIIFVYVIITANRTFVAY